MLHKKIRKVNVAVDSVKITVAIYEISLSIFIRKKMKPFVKISNLFISILIFYYFLNI